MTDEPRECQHDYDPYQICRKCGVNRLFGDLRDENRGLRTDLEAARQVQDTFVQVHDEDQRIIADLRAERDNWKLDHSLLSDDYKQLVIQLTVANERITMLMQVLDGEGVTVVRKLDEANERAERAERDRDTVARNAVEVMRYCLTHHGAGAGSS